MASIVLCIQPEDDSTCVRSLCEVTSPDIKQISDIESEINKRVEKAAVLNTQRGYDSGNVLKISAFTNMVPTNSQEHDYSTVEKDTQYTKVQSKKRSERGSRTVWLRTLNAFGQTSDRSVAG